MQHSILKSLKRERLFNLSVFSSLEKSEPSYGQFTLAELKEIFSETNISEEKTSVPLISGTRFKQKNRQKTKALYSDLLILDLDAKNYSYSPQEITNKFSKYTYFAHQTHSSNPRLDEYRWRIILPLDRPADPSEYEATWRLLVKELRLDADLSTSSINAIFFLPARQATTKQQFISNNADLIKPKYLPIDINKNQDNKTEDFGGLLNTVTRITELNYKDLAINGFKSRIEYKDSYSVEEIEEITSQPAVGLTIARLLGINVGTCGIEVDSKLTSRSLKSILPWSTQDNKPSTGLFIKTSGEGAGRVLYRSFRDEDADNPVYDLHYVYACIKTGKRISSESWTRSTSLVWLVRTLIDCGVLPRISVSLQEKANLNGVELNSRLIKGMEELVEVRAILSIYDNELIPFAYSFAELWVGMSRQTCSKAFKKMMSAGVIEQVTVKTRNMRINGFKIC